MSLKSFEYYYENIKSISCFNKFNKYDYIKILNYIKDNNISINNVDEYLNINCQDCENCYCCINCYECGMCCNCKNCYKCNWCKKCINCYSSNGSKNCNWCITTDDSINCNDCILCHNCINCINCYGTDNGYKLCEKNFEKYPYGCIERDYILEL